MLKAIGHRIIVKPDAPATESLGGLILPEDRDHVAVSGTVVSLGPGGDMVRFRARQQAITECLVVLEQWSLTFQHPSSLTIAKEEVARLLGTPPNDREIAVGDRVVFPEEAGVNISEDGERYVVLNEDDVAVIVAEEAEAA